MAKLDELNEAIAELEQKINDSDSDISDDILRLKLLETQEMRGSVYQGNCMIQPCRI